MYILKYIFISIIRILKNIYKLLNILLQNITIISPDENKNILTDIFVENGKISQIDKNLQVDNTNTEILDCTGKTAVPGFFDMHVHFRDPGAVYKEDINSGIEAAANGGFTGVLMMPNTNPPLSDKNSITDLKSRVKGKIVDTYISATISKNRKGGEINNIKECLEAGAIAFTDDGSPVTSPDLMKEILKLSAEYDFLVMQHSEDTNLSRDGVINEGEISEKMKVKGIPRESEISTVNQDIAIANLYNGSHYHVQHISCGETYDIIKNARMHNKNITAEICPHHFILTEKAIYDSGSNAKMNPPLRLQSDIEILLQGIKDGAISAICTDHAPHSLEEKQRSIEDSPFGIIGLETSIGLSYKYLVSENIISFEKLIYLMSINPRKLLKLTDIRFDVGCTANMTILDTNKKWRINKDKFKSKSRNTPFDGFYVECKPFAIINNNQIYISDL